MRRDFAAVFGLPADRFHVLVGEVGGGFGPRNIAYPEYAAVMLAARLTGRAGGLARNAGVNRFLTDIQGRGVRVRGRLATDAAGRFTALSMSTMTRTLGAYISPVAVFANINNPLQSLTGCYAIPAAHAVFRMMHSMPCRPARIAAPGGRRWRCWSSGWWILRRSRLGLDPFVLRERNIIPFEAFPWTLPSGARYDSGDFGRLMRTARAASDWDGFEDRMRGGTRGAAWAGDDACSLRFRGAAGRRMRRH